MSDSSNPSVDRANEGNETEPFGGGSSAPSLGAPAPAPEPDADEPDTDKPDTGEPGSPSTPDRDVHNDPEQVS